MKNRMRMLFLLAAASLTGCASAYVAEPISLVSTERRYASTNLSSVATTIEQPPTSNLEQTRESVIEHFLNGPKPVRGGGDWVSDLSLEETYEFIGKSFAGTEDVAGEPMMSWLCSEVQFSSHEEKADLINFMLSFVVLENLANQAMVFAKRLPNRELSAMTMVIPYNPAEQEGLFSKALLVARKYLHLGKFIVAGKLPTFLQGTTGYHKKIQKEIDESTQPLQDTIAKWHKRYGPSQRHWYIGTVASDPEYQGQGQGSELMGYVMEMADLVQMDCYLECGNEKNKNFYKKFGFSVVAEEKLTSTLNHNPHKMYLMVRPHH